MAGDGSLYERVGGEPWFIALVDRFYEGVERDEVLRPLYPPDLAAPRTRLAGFLAQYWGGPPNYSAARGHPRLRMRHMGFAIGAAQRDAWIVHMTEAVRGAGLAPEDEDRMLSYFANAATMLINTSG
ncbi:MAG: globin domain-containing protein [Acidimicrobiales bacterium]